MAPPVLKSNYKKGETVLAKWTDCKLYTATVLKKIDKGNSMLPGCIFFVQILSFCDVTDFFS